MSKFKKILVLTLMLALTLTAFAVVSLAADEPKAVNVGGHKTDTTFESFVVGSKPFTKQDDGTDGGIFISEAYPGGNKYLEMIGSSGSKASLRYSTFISDDYNRRTTYTLAKYPVVAVDFDIMSPDGNWGLYSATNTGNSAGMYFRPYIGSSMQGTGLLNELTFGLLGLTDEKGVWQHVTVTFEMSYSSYGDVLISQKVYIDGKIAKDFGEKNMTSKHPDIDSTKLFIGPIYFRTTRAYSNSKLVGHQAIDNIQFTYFEPGYEESKASTYIYNGNYEMPYGITVARIGKGYYDNVSTAIDAAQSGDVIRLVSDIEKVVTVDKAVTIDTNKYDEEGNPTGKYYSIKTSSNTFVSSEADGFISFKQVQNASMQIYWDDCPGVAAGGECTCPSIYLDENGKHLMEAFTPYAMLNSTPNYPGEIPDFPIVGATEKRFIGWSLEQGGEPVSLTPITSSQISDGWLSLYPVYEEYTYPYELINANGVSTFYTDSGVFSTAPANSTIKLHKDVRVSTITLPQRNITLDLNGHSFLNLTTNEIEYEVTYDEATGTYVKVLDEEGNPLKKTVTTTNGNDVMFYFQGQGHTFTLKSSRPGSVVANVTVNADKLICGGEVVDTVVTKVVGRRIFYPYSAKQCVVNILGEGITFYADEIFMSTHGGDNVSMNVDGGTYCYVPEESKDANGMFTVKTGGTHYIKNATIYVNGDYLIRNATKDRDRNTQYYFENCNIYNAKIYSSYVGDTLHFENCRLNVTSVSGATVNLGHNNLLSSNLSQYVFEEGVEVTEVSESLKFNSPASDYTAIIDFDTLMPIPLPGTATQNVKFTHKTYNPLYAPTEVTFKDFDGNVIGTVTAEQNRALKTPSSVKLDGYRVVTNPVWVNEADGTALGETLGSEASYTFKATLPETPVYEADLSVVMMNMSYYNGFAYNVYLPAGDIAEFISVNGEALSGALVYIDSNPYYLYSVAVASTRAFEDVALEVKYSVDGAEYTADFVINALVYAQGSMESAQHSVEDKNASKALIKYIEALCKYVAGGELSLDAAEKLAAFYAVYPAIDYVTEYPAAENCQINEAIDEYIKTIYFRISNGSRIALAAELNDEALAAGYTLKINGNEFDVVKGTLCYTASVPVYSALMTPVYEISIVDAEGVTVATTQYSMVSYIVAMEAAGRDVDVVKALYTFGKATLEVRNNAFAE